MGGGGEDGISGAAIVPWSPTWSLEPGWRRLGSRGGDRLNSVSRAPHDDWSTSACPG